MSSMTDANLTDAELETAATVNHPVFVKRLIAEVRAWRKLESAALCVLGAERDALRRQGAEDRKALDRTAFELAKAVEERDARADETRTWKLHFIRLLLEDHARDCAAIGERGAKCNCAWSGGVNAGEEMEKRAVKAEEERDAARSQVAEMVAKAADTKLAGYRALGEKAARAEELLESSRSLSDQRRERIEKLEAALQEIGEIYSTGPADDWEPDFVIVARKMLRAKVQHAREALGAREVKP